MQNNKFAQVSRLFLQNQKGMIKEQDIINLFSSIENYKTTIKQVVQYFRKIGFRLIRTEFEGTRYFVLSTRGKDDEISPSMYGVLSILIAMYNDIGKNLGINKLKRVFRDVWSEVELLIQAKYLKEATVDNEKVLLLTPLAKAATQEIAKDLSIRNFVNMKEKK